MKHFRIFGVFIVSFVILASLCAAQEKNNYFPLSAGSWWRYRVADGKDTVLVKVTGTEKIGNENCYKVETLFNYKVEIIEYLFSSGLNIMEKRVILPADSFTLDYKPAKKILPNPLKEGDIWVYKGKDIGYDNSVQIKKAVKNETVKVPAGVFNAMKVTCDITNGKEKISKAVWYAPGVGVIKSITKTTKKATSIVLVEYKVK